MTIAHDQHANNSGKGVGGGSVHWAAFTPRLHPSDFEVYTRDGVGADWPIDYGILRPYYEQLELEMPVAGPAYYPWGHPHGYIYGPHPMGGVGNALIEGCTALNIPVSIGGPVAILAGSHGDRPHCIYRGFCIQGCKVGAKASTLVTHVPDALASGADLRMAASVEHQRLQCRPATNDRCGGTCASRRLRCRVPAQQDEYSPVEWGSRDSSGR
jgi:choline dehydrogenase-like flavoprotein